MGAVLPGPQSLPRPRARGAGEAAGGRLQDGEAAVLPARAVSIPGPIQVLTNCLPEVRRDEGLLELPAGLQTFLHCAGRESSRAAV